MLCTAGIHNRRRVYIYTSSILEIAYSVCVANLFFDAFAFRPSIESRCLFSRCTQSRSHMRPLPNQRSCYALPIHRTNGNETVT